MRRTLGEWDVFGIGIDTETRCAHYRADHDVIALRFGCCAIFYSCYQCHRAIADHEPEPWPRNRFNEPTVLCGVCRTVLSPREYLDTGDACPFCLTAFNPGCARHHDLYFARDQQVNQK